MEIAINRKGEAKVKTTQISGPAPSATLKNNPNLAHVTDDRWKAYLGQFVDQQRRTGTLPQVSSTNLLYLWYLHAKEQYGNSRSHRKSSFTKYQVMLLEEEAGFTFPRSAPAIAAIRSAHTNQVQEGKAEAGTKSSSTGGGAGSPRIRIKIPKVGAASGMGSNNSGSQSNASTPKVLDTPMDVDDEASFPNDLPIAGITMTPAQRKSLEETPPDATTMAILVRRFAKILARQQYECNAAVDLDHVMTLLGAPKNRMMELVEILEGIGLVELTNGEEGSSVIWLGSEGMLMETDEEGEGSEGSSTAAAQKTKREDADTLREEIGKLYHEER